MDRHQRPTRQFARETVEPVIDVIGPKILEFLLAEERDDVPVGQNAIGLDGLAVAALESSGKPVLHGVFDRVVLWTLHTGR